jgi:hypothetical protein
MYDKEIVMGFEIEVPCEIAEEAKPCIMSDVRGVPTFGQRSKGTKAVPRPGSYQINKPVNHANPYCLCIIMYPSLPKTYPLSLWSRGDSRGRVLKNV